MVCLLLLHNKPPS